MAKINPPWTFWMDQPNGVQLDCVLSSVFCIGFQSQSISYMLANICQKILLMKFCWLMQPHKFCHINACLDLLILWFGNPHIKPVLIWWTDLFCVGSCINQWRWSHQSSHHCRVNLKIKKMKTMFILRFYHLFRIIITK